MFVYCIKIILLLSLFFNACGSSNKQAKNTGTSSDSITNKTDSMPQPPHPDPGLSPGFAKINATILSKADIKNSKTEQLMVLKVHQVLEYGSSTPALASNDSLKISINKEQLADNELVPSGQHLTLLIYHQRKPALGDEDPTPWAFSKLIVD